MQRPLIKLCENAIVLLLLALGGTAAAQSSYDRIVSAEVIEGWRNADGQHIAGLRLTLAPGWKTYWRVPGEAGIPPAFSWNGSRNVRGVQVVWPTPKVFDQAGSQSVGYADVVTLPLAVTTRQGTKPARLKGRIQIGLCQDICIPETLTIDAALPSSGSRAPAIVAALADRPFSADEASVRSARCEVRPIEGGMAVRAEVTMPSAGTPEAVVIEAPDPQLYITQARTQRSGEVLSAEAKVYHVDGGVFALSRETLRLTVIGTSFAVDIRGCSGT